jgi:hypothetical protein
MDQMNKKYLCDAASQYAATLVISNDGTNAHIIFNPKNNECLLHLMQGRISDDNPEDQASLDKSESLARAVVTAANKNLITFHGKVDEGLLDEFDRNSGLTLSSPDYIWDIGIVTEWIEMNEGIPSIDYSSIDYISGFDPSVCWIESNPAWILRDHVDTSTLLFARNERWVKAFTGGRQMDI